MAVDSLLRKVLQTFSELQVHAQAKGLTLTFEADRMDDENGVDVLLSIIGNAVDHFDEVLITTEEELESLVETITSILND